MNMYAKPLALVGALATAMVLAGATLPAFAAKTNLTVGMVLEPPNLDPTGGAAAAIDEVVYANVFEGLTRFGSDGAILPALAWSWDISEDGLVYTFNLAPGVKFHDGTDMTADDVVFSFERAVAEDSTNAQKALFADIATVEAVNDTTVRITLSKPNGNFLFNMAWGDAVIVAPESAADNATNPIGTGPFVFVNWAQGDNVALARNPDYWGEPAKLENVVFKFISDPTAAFSAMMAEDVDAFPNFPAPETLPQLDADPRFNVIVGTTEGETILTMNNRREPLNNIKVRQAIAHAINRQAIIDGAMFGFGEPIGTHFNPTNIDYVDLTAQSNYDPEKSKALLAEAGITDLTLSLKLPPPTYARRGGEIIAAQLRAVGINTEITNVEWSDWVNSVFLNDRDFDLTIVSHTEPFDIGIYGRDDYYFGYDNAEFKQIMADLNNATDPAERSKLLGDAQRRIADDYVVAFLFQLAKTGVANSKLVGLWENSPTQANDLTGVYWQE